MAVTDAQLDAGEVSVAVQGDEAAPLIVSGTGQGQRVPVGGLPVVLLLEKPAADLTADLGTGLVIGERAQQYRQFLLCMAQLLLAVGA